MATSQGLSEYELARLENIKKNEEFLKSIGLFKDPTIAKPAADILPKSKNKLKRRQWNDGDEDYVQEPDKLPLRRSGRNVNIIKTEGENKLVSLSDVEGTKAGEIKYKKLRRDPRQDADAFFKQLESTTDNDDEEDDISKRVVLKPYEIREYIDSIHPEHNDKISDAAVKHCAYRCGYMSLAALTNRLRAISSGASKKSYEKLLVVSYTMKAMGLHRLAERSAQLLKTRTGMVLDWHPTLVKGESAVILEDVLGDSTVVQSEVKGENTMVHTENMGENCVVHSEVKEENVDMGKKITIATTTRSKSSSNNITTNSGNSSISIKKEDIAIENTTIPGIVNTTTPTSVKQHSVKLESPTCITVISTRSQRKAIKEESYW